MADDWSHNIERRIGMLETRTAVEEVHRINVESRLGSIEDSLKWLVRLIIGSLIAAGLAFAISGGLATSI